MRRAQSNSPRVPPKKHHSFRELRSAQLDNLLLLPGYRPARPRPPSYPAHAGPPPHHASPARDQLHVPRIRVTCSPDPAPTPPRRPQVRHWSPARGPSRSPQSRGRSPDSRGRSSGRRVSQTINLS